MIMGNLSGLVNGTEQVVFDYEVTGSAASSISTGNILNGDEDGWYTVIVRARHATAANVYLNFNSDLSANYGIRLISASNTTVSNSAATARVGIFLSFGAVNNSSLTVARVYAKSGAVRLVNMLEATNISGTTVTTLYPGGGVWNNSADNIVSAQLVSASGSGLGVGTRIIILKSNNFTGGTPTGSITTPYIKGSWVRVGSQVLGSAASSVTFSGLDGDRDVVYYILAQIKATGNIGNATITFNSDTSSSNYGYQYLTATNTTVSANRSTIAGLLFMVATTNAYYAYGNQIIFAKKGFLRPAIGSYIRDINGTTISYIQTHGCSWSNTSDNIQSLTIAGAANFDAGSQFDLYALRPGG